MVSSQTVKESLETQSRNRLLFSAFGRETLSQRQNNNKKHLIDNEQKNGKVPDRNTEKTDKRRARLIGQLGCGNDQSITQPTLDIYELLVWFLGGNEIITKSENCRGVGRRKSINTCHAH